MKILWMKDNELSSDSKNNIEYIKNYSIIELRKINKLSERQYAYCSYLIIYIQLI